MSTKGQVDSEKLERKKASPRVARRRARTRERILAVAGKLFASHGVDGTTLTDIADAADVSRGNLYSHFGSKQALLDAIIEPMVAYAMEQIGSLAELPPAQALEGILRAHATMWREIPGALSVAHQFHGVSIGEPASVQRTPDTWPKGHAVHSVSKEPTDATQPPDMTRIFEQAADEGLLRVEPALALKIFNATAVPLLELCQEAPDPDELFVESMLRLLLRD
jgi:AcrR family transcriptional regulator